MGKKLKPIFTLHLSPKINPANYILTVLIWKCLMVLYYSRTKKIKGSFYIKRPWWFNEQFSNFKVDFYMASYNNITYLKGVLHLWALFLKTLCIFSKNKATSDKVSYGSGQKCSKELENYSFTSVETIVVKLQWKMCENQYFPCFEP